MNKSPTILKFSLCLLLGSCGKDSGGGGKPQDFSESEAVVKQGLVKGLKGLTTREGKVYDAHGTVRTVEAKDESIVLKVSEYQFVRTMDPERGYAWERVNLEKLDIEDLKQALKLPGATLVGSLLTIPSTGESWYQSGEDKVVRRYSTKQTVNLENPACQFTGEEQDTDVTLTSSGISKKLPNLFQSSRGNCIGVASEAELKKLDLTRVTFCDHTKDDSYCEQTDLSHPL